MMYGLACRKFYTMDDDETAMYDVRSSRDVVPLPGTLREDGRGQAETHREISAVIGATADPDSELDAAANSALSPPLIPQLLCPSQFTFSRALFASPVVHATHDAHSQAPARRAPRPWVRLKLSIGRPDRKVRYRRAQMADTPSAAEYRG